MTDRWVVKPETRESGVTRWVAEHRITGITTHPTGYRQAKEEAAALNARPPRRRFRLHRAIALVAGILLVGACQQPPTVVVNAPQPCYREVHSFGVGDNGVQFAYPITYEQVPC